MSVLAWTYVVLSYLVPPVVLFTLARPDVCLSSSGGSHWIVRLACQI
jgi:hypothetical protein